MRNTQNNQAGAALLVSLIMLLLLTIIGVTSVEDMALQSNMARNSQFKMQAFNTAFSESEAQYEKLPDNVGLLTLAMNLGSYSYLPGDLEMASTTNPFDQTASLQFSSSGGAVIAQGSGEAMSMGSMETASFEINSYAELSNTGSKSDQLQGLDYAAPKNSSE